MAQTVTNRGKHLFATGAIVPGTTDLRMGLLKTLAAHTNVPEVNFVADMESHADFAELTVGEASGYARVALTTEVATEFDGAQDYSAVDSDNVSFGALGTGGTIVGAFIFVEGASDAARPVVAIYDLPSTPTNGGTVTVNVADFIRLI
jgi:hypothetical protein